MRFRGAEPNFTGVSQETTMRYQAVLPTRPPIFHHLLASDVRNWKAIGL